MAAGCCFSPTNLANVYLSLVVRPLVDMKKKQRNQLGSFGYLKRMVMMRKCCKRQSMYVVVKGRQRERLMNQSRRRCQEDPKRGSYGVKNRIAREMGFSREIGMSG